MKPVIPKQHGAWAMLIIPFLLNVLLGNPKIGHIPLFLAWLFLYLSTYPFLMSLKKTKKQKEFIKSFVFFFLSALLFLLYPLLDEPRLIYFGVAMIPFFYINMYFSKQKQDRALLNDIIAVFIFGIGGLASYFYGTGIIDEKAVLIFLLIFLYFLGTIFYVKTMIREKKNVKYKYVSWAYHIGLQAVFIIIGQFGFALSYLFSTIRAIILYGKKVSIKTIGITEILSSVFFTIIIILVLI